MKMKWVLPAGEPEMAFAKWSRNDFANQNENVNMKTDSFQNENEMSSAGWRPKKTFAKWVMIHFAKWKWECQNGNGFISKWKWLYIKMILPMDIHFHSAESHFPKWLSWNESIFILTFPFSFCKINPDSFSKGHFVCSDGRIHFISIVKWIHFHCDVSF